MGQVRRRQTILRPLTDIQPKKSKLSKFSLFVTQEVTDGEDDGWAKGERPIFDRQESTIGGSNQGLDDDNNCHSNLKRLHSVLARKRDVELASKKLKRSKSKKGDEEERQPTLAHTTSVSQAQVMTNGRISE